MTTLNLPEELVLAVFKQLSRQDLCKVSLVSKSFARIAAPLLYTSCDLTAQDIWQERENLVGFIRVLTSKPYAASFVRHLSTGILPTIPPIKRRAPIRSFVDIRPLEQSTANAFHPSWPPRAFELWNTLVDLSDHSHDKMTAILLSTVPNLTTLTIRMVHDNLEEDLCLTPSTFREVFVRHAPVPRIFGRNHTINNVTAVELTGTLDTDRKNRGWDFQIVAQFIKLPSIHRFTGRGCYARKRLSNWTCETHSSNLKQLILADCKLGPAAIQKVLNSCRALEVFECQRKCPSCENVQHPCNYSCDSFLPELLQHRHSLHRLIIHSMSCDHPTNPYVSNPIGCLKELSRLEHLEIDEPTLHGMVPYATMPIGELLPSRLRSMVYMTCFDRDHATLFRQVGQLLLANEESRTFAVEDAVIVAAEEVTAELPEILFEKPKKKFGRPHCIIARRRGLYK